MNEWTGTAWYHVATDNIFETWNVECLRYVIEPFILNELIYLGEV